MEKEEENKHKLAHCLILPYPIQGHINPMLQFSKRLAHNGIKITLATTKHLFTTTAKEFSDRWISVETISDGFDEGQKDEALKTYLERFQQVGTKTLVGLLEKLRDLGCPVDCLIYDPFLPWGLAVAKKFGLLGAPSFTQLSYVNNMPSFVRDPKSHAGSFELLVNQFQNIENADFVFVNSVYELEPEATDWMAKLLPVKTIGPTIPSMYLDKRLPQDKNYGLNIFKPINACMKWLDERANGSVIYVSFGSMAKLEREQMMELALAMKITSHQRNPNSLKLLQQIYTLEKGLIVSWSPQLEVLAYGAIGCFVTHCGWNSMLEALSLGVPMVAVP
ncbi:hypothetical protein DH2020_006052 [Rehmannia glutinosa]|uniref:UDP-glycosyltransferase n=1 Tax=Rehmannia glutinosa TaxID=99300 RepID=A0ABR0XI80_REHGL